MTVTYCINGDIPQRVLMWNGPGFYASIHKVVNGRRLIVTEMMGYTPEEAYLKSWRKGHGTPLWVSEPLGDSIEDEEAARAAGCHFMHADEFFDRSNEG